MKLTRSASVVLVVACLGATLGVAGCKVEKGSGNAKTEQREVAEFDEVEASSGVDVDVVVGARAPIEVKGDDNLLPHVKTVVNGTRLTISIDGSISALTPLHVHVMVPTLKLLDVKSGATMKVSGVNADALELDAASGGKLEVQGVAKKVSVDASGGAHVAADTLVAETVDTKATAGSEVSVSASSSADGSTSSGAKVHVKGHPQTKSVSEKSGGVVDYD